VNRRFAVAIDGIGETRAVAVVLPQARVGASRAKRPVVRYSELILRRGLAAGDEWYAWWARSRTARAASRTILVTLLDSAGSPVVCWTFPGAKPVAYSVSSLDALGAEIVVETLELAVGGFDAQFGAVPAGDGRARRVDKDRGGR
jgi:phage tail-like protein